MSGRKIYLSEHLAFDPKRVWLVLASSGKDTRLVWSVHTTKRDAEKAAYKLQDDQPGVGAEVTQGVLMPNFNVQ